jgi:WD40 repeat protein
MRRRGKDSAALDGFAMTPVWNAALPDSAACAAWSSDRKVLGVATLAGPVLFFEVGSRDRSDSEIRLLREDSGHTGGALAVAFCAGSPLVATGGQDGYLNLLVPAGDAPATRLFVGTAPVTYLAWSPSGAVLAAASGRAVRFYSRQGELLGEYTGHASTVMSLCFSGAAEGWISACYGGVHVLSQRTLQCERHLFARTSILAVAQSPCGRYIAAGAQDPVVRLWDLGGGDEPVHLEGYKGKIATLSWSPEAPVLATASGASVVLWSFAGGDLYEAPHAELSGHTGRVNALCFLAGGRALLTAAADGHIRLFDLMESSHPIEAIDTGAPVHLIDSSPTGDFFIAAGKGASLNAWSLSRAAPPVVQERRARARSERRASS